MENSTIFFKPSLSECFDLYDIWTVQYSTNRIEIVKTGQERSNNKFLTLFTNGMIIIQSNKNSYLNIMEKTFLVQTMG